MTTYGDALRMMQVGGVDRTGFADMADALGTPGLDLIKQRRADAAEEERLAALAEALTPTQPTSTPTDDGESNNIVYEFGKGIDDYFESLLTDKGQDIYTGAKDQVRDMYGSFIEDPNPFKVDDLSVPIDADNDGTISDYEQVLSDLENDEKMMDLRNSLYYNYVEPAKDAVGNFLSTPQSQFAIDAIRLPLLMAKDKFIDPYFKSDDDPMTFKADGGRVEAFSGGVMNNLLGSSQMQNMMQQQGLQNQIYQQPTIGFQPMPNPGDFDFVPLPDPRMGTGTPPPATAKAYNPFVSNMPLYDPSTLGTGLPSTAGMTDPYFSYDPYSAAGAFDAPPANIGGFLSRKEIEDTFKDLDKFTLSKQKDSKKSSSTSTGETRRGGGGEGKAQRDKFARDRAKREANAKIGTLDRNLRGDKPGSAGPGGGKSCFVKGTMLQMADGTEKEISTVELGDNTKGGIVEMTMQGLPQTIYNYKGVLVSGSHWVIEDNEFVAVEDSKHGVLTDKVEPVYTLKTSEHRMWINDIEFGDFETGSDDDWEPHFEAVRKKLNEELRSGHI